MMKRMLMICRSSTVATRLKMSLSALVCLLLIGCGEAGEILKAASMNITLPEDNTIYYGALAIQNNDFCGGNNATLGVGAVFDRLTQDDAQAAALQLCLATRNDTSTSCQVWESFEWGRGFECVAVAQTNTGCGWSSDIAATEAQVRTSALKGCQERNQEECSVIYSNCSEAAAR